jgi:DNA polymerase-3 subunit beta
MKITVRINEFKRVLEEARYVMGRNEAMTPVLEFVRIDVQSSNQATISGTDLNFSIVQAFEVVDGDVGSFLLHAKKTADFLKQHVDGTATIETTPDSKNTIVKTGTVTMTVPTMLVSGFPAIEAMCELKYEVSLKFLKKLIELVDFACPSLRGKNSVPNIKLESDGIKLRAAATDGFRIAVSEAPGNFGVFDWQVQKSVVPMLKRRQGAIVQLGESETNHFFRTETVLLQCRKPMTTFPQYERAFQQRYRTEIKLPVLSLKNLITAILPVTNPHNPKIDITVLGDAINVSGGSDTAGFSDVTQTIEKTGDNNRASFNPKYILEFLKHVEGIVVTINLSTDHSLAKFSNDKGEYEYFIMPKQEKDKPGLAFQGGFTRFSEEWRNKILARDCDEAWAENQAGSYLEEQRQSRASHALVEATRAEEQKKKDVEFEERRKTVSLRAQETWFKLSEKNRAYAVNAHWDCALAENLRRDPETARLAALEPHDDSSKQPN